ncbi:MAG: hypothetical protein KGY99_00020 [Phycisphaerae bacterium]|nr:hypothetical protein [Phycisphaerae bacterium]
MRDELTDILHVVRRRFLRARAAEAAAVGAAVAALASVGIELAWLVGDASVIAGGALCGLAATACAWTGWSARLRRRIGAERVVMNVAGAVAAVGALIALGVLVFGRADAVDAWVWPMTLVPATALIEVAAMVARGADVRRAATWVDRRAGLSERLSTAAELVGQPDEPAAQCVRRQALQAARSDAAQRVSFWRRTRATAGALGLAMLLAAAVALLPAAVREDGDSAPPVAKQPPRTPEPARVVAPEAKLSRERFAGMSVAERRALARGLRRRAEAARDPKRAAALRQAAKAAERGDYAELVRQLERGGAEAVRLSSGTQDAAGDNAGSPTVKPPMTVDDAPGANWQAARRRAERALRGTGNVPEEYRAVVRAFYLAWHR